MTEGAEVSQKFPVVMGETQERAEFRNIPRRESLLDTLNFVRVDFETTRGNNMTQILDSLEAKFTLISIQTRAELAELPQDPIRKPVEGVGSRVPSFLGTLTTGEAHSDFSTGSRVPCLTARSRKSSTFDLNAKGTWAVCKPGRRSDMAAPLVQMSLPLTPRVVSFLDVICDLCPDDLNELDG